MASIDARVQPFWFEQAITRPVRKNMLNGKFVTGSPKGPALCSESKTKDMKKLTRYIGSESKKVNKIVRVTVEVQP